MSSIEEVVEFEGIGIRRVTSEETKTSLEMRKNRGIDPFNLGYINKQGNYNKEAVRLCFEVGVQKHLSFVDFFPSRLSYIM